MTNGTPPRTLTLEQAWHYVMTQFAYRNPGKVVQANLARKALRNIRTGRRGTL